MLINILPTWKHSIGMSEPINLNYQILPFPIIISSEPHFTLDGFLSKQNCRIWIEKILE